MPASVIQMSASPTCIGRGCLLQGEWFRACKPPVKLDLPPSANGTEKRNCASAFMHRRDPDLSLLLTMGDGKRASAELPILPVQSDPNSRAKWPLPGHGLR